MHHQMIHTVLLLVTYLCMKLKIYFVGGGAERAAPHDSGHPARTRQADRALLAPGTAFSHIFMYILNKNIYAKHVCVCVCVCGCVGKHL